LCLLGSLSLYMRYLIILIERLLSLVLENRLLSIFFSRRKKLRTILFAQNLVKSFEYVNWRTSLFILVLFSSINDSIITVWKRKCIRWFHIRMIIIFIICQHLGEWKILAQIEKKLTELLTFRVTKNVSIVSERE